VIYYTLTVRRSRTVKKGELPIQLSEALPEDNRFV
jgi:hypothetical protein